MPGTRGMRDYNSQTQIKKINSYYHMVCGDNIIGGE